MGEANKGFGQHGPNSAFLCGSRWCFPAQTPLFAGFRGRGRRSLQAPSDGFHDNTRVPLHRIAWLVTVVAALVTSLLLLLSGYQGYAGVALAVGLSAAINLL
jgi:hypothetical protein